jgi:hypothetical protein
MINLLDTTAYQIQDLTIVDPIGNQVLSNSADPDEDVRTAIKIGMRFLQGVSSSAASTIDQERLLTLIKQEITNSHDTTQQRLSETLRQTQDSIHSSHRSLEQRVSDGLNNSLGSVSSTLYSTLTEASSLLTSTGRLVERQSTAKRGVDYESPYSIKWQ